MRIQYLNFISDRYPNKQTLIFLLGQPLRGVVIGKGKNISMSIVSVLGVGLVLVDSGIDYEYEV